MQGICLHARNMSTCICIYTYIHIYIYMYTYIRTTYIHTYICVYIYLFMFVCMCIYLYVYLYVYVYLYLYLYLYIYIYSSHTHTHACESTCNLQVCAEATANGSIWSLHPFSDVERKYTNVIHLQQFSEKAEGAACPNMHCSFTLFWQSAFMVKDSGFVLVVCGCGGEDR